MPCAELFSCVILPYFNIGIIFRRLVYMRPYWFVLIPSSFSPVAICMCELALPVLFSVKSEWTRVGMALCPCHRALPNRLIFYPRTCVEMAWCPFALSLPVRFVIWPLAKVPITIWKDFITMAVKHVIFHFALITLWIFIKSTISIGEEGQTQAVQLTVDPVAILDLSTNYGLYSRSVWLIVLLTNPS